MMFPFLSVALKASLCSRIPFAYLNSVLEFSDIYHTWKEFKYSNLRTFTIKGNQQGEKNFVELAVNN